MGLQTPAAVRVPILVSLHSTLQEAYQQVLMNVGHQLDWQKDLPL